MRLTALLFILATPAFGQEPISVPSGQGITLQDVILNQPGPQGLTARFRFIAPAISRETGTISFDVASLDMDHLCQTYALPRTLTATGPVPSQIIVSLADRAVGFGDITPEATQFFEAYAIQGSDCIWESF